MDVCASAEFLTEIGNHHDADVGSVFFAEERHRAGGDGLIQRHHVRRDFGVAENLLVHQPFDFGQLRGIQSGVMAKVETEARRLHNAARLFDMRSENLAERGVQ